MALDLSKVGERDSLPVKREPHWQRLRPGCYLGYRPSRREGAGTWIGRAYDEDAKRYRYLALGEFVDEPARERFVFAKQEAERFAQLVDTGGYIEDRPTTVEEACRRYTLTNPEAEGRFRRYVYNDFIGQVKLHRLRRHHLVAWRTRLEEIPSLVSRSKKKPAVTRPRAPASVNRDIAMMRAALNQVLAHGAPGSEAAWQEALKSVRNASRQRTLYLDKAQRRALLAVMDEEAEPFFRSLCLLPLRPGAAAQLVVEDFEERTGELTIGKDKAGKGRRILIPQAVIELFAEQSAGKARYEPLISRANGKAWDNYSWRGPMKQAVADAKLPPNATAYTLRHSTITDLINEGLPLLSVAQISGTSTEMIERHYGHLNRGAAAKALATLDL
ncbi:MAG: tyrosine-type recombinase/integrase [Sphingopyxis solisilvae]|uniref:tyrosine-type recombinase/integrase n=1 Tax=Sphingopyxis solisilvae TaxID=1886788 RepID=UPI00403739D6